MGCKDIGIRLDHGIIWLSLFHVNSVQSATKITDTIYIQYIHLTLPAFNQMNILTIHFSLLCTFLQFEYFKYFDILDDKISILQVSVPTLSKEAWKSQAAKETRCWQLDQGETGRIYIKAGSSAREYQVDLED